VNHREVDSGTIRVGAAADLVILDGDPFSGDDIASIQVDMTVVDGRTLSRSA